MNLASIVVGFVSNAGPQHDIFGNCNGAIGANAVTYAPIYGFYALYQNTIESAQQVVHGFRVNLTGLKAYAYNLNNATGPSTIRTRINGANGTLLVTVGAGLTGWFVDTAHTDFLGPTDKLCYQVTAGPGPAGNVLLTNVVGVTEIAPFPSQVSPTRGYSLFGNTGGAAAVGANTFSMLGGGNAAYKQAVEANAQVAMPVAGVLSNLSIQGPTSGTFTGRLRKNLANANQQVNDGNLFVPPVNDYTLSPWSQFNVTVTPAATTNPITGATDAQLVVPTTANNGHVVNQTISVNVAGNYTLSWYLKASGYTYNRILVQQSGFFAYATFNLSGAGSMFASGISASGGVTFVSGSIVSLGSGWYLCTLNVGNILTTSSIIVEAGPCDNTGNATFAGDGTSGAYEWGGRFVLTSSVPSTLTSNAFDNVALGDTIDLAWDANTSGQIQRTRLTLVGNPYHGAVWGSTPYNNATTAIPINNSAYHQFVGFNQAYPGLAQYLQRCQLKIGVAGLMQGLGLNAPVNAAASSVTLSLNLNGATAALGPTIGAGLTGAFIDTTRQVAVVPGDLVCGNTLAIPASFSVSSVWVGFVNPSAPSNDIWFGVTAGLVQTAGVYFPLVGGGQYGGITPESVAQTAHGFAVTMSGLRVYVDTSTSTAPASINTRKNGVNGNQIVTIGAGLTGWFQDTANTDSYAPTDLACYRSVVGSAGLSGVYYIGVTETAPLAPAPAIPARGWSLVGMTNYGVQGFQTGAGFTLPLTESMRLLQATETAGQLPMPVAGTLGGLTASQGAVTGNWSAQLRKNSANANQVINDGNLVKWCNDYTQTSVWGNGDVTITTAALVNPITGRPDAQKVVPDTVNTYHFLSQQIAGIPQGATTTLSVYAKNANYNFAFVQLTDGTIYVGANFDLTTGAVTYTQGSVAGATLVSTSAVAVGSGWWLLSVTVMFAASSPNIQIYAFPTGGIPSYAGDGTSGIYLFGVKVTWAPVLNSGSDYTNPAWIQQDVTVTPAATSNPLTGANDAQKITPDTVNTGHQVHQPISFASGVANTLTVYCKNAGYNFAFISFSDFVANAAGIVVDLSSGEILNIQQVGSMTLGLYSAVMMANGWWKITLTGTATTSPVHVTIHPSATGGTAPFAGDGVSGIYAYGAQLTQAAAVAPPLTSLAKDTCVIGDLMSLSWGVANGTGTVQRLQMSLLGSALHSAIYGSAYPNTNPASFPGNNHFYMPLWGYMMGAVLSQLPYVNNMIGAAGTLQNLSINLPINNMTGASAFTIYQNGAVANLGPTIGVGLTGIFTDTRQLQVNQGDMVCTHLFASGGSFLPTGLTVGFVNPNAPANDLNVHVYAGLVAGTTTYYQIYGDSFSLGGVTEVVAQTAHGFGVTMSGMRVGIATNTTTSISTAAIRVNGVTGNSKVTIGVGLTGWFVDSVNQDFCGYTDKVAYQVVAGAGSGSPIVVSFIGAVETAPANPPSSVLMGASGSIGIAATTGNFSGLAGSGFVGSGVTESFIAYPMPVAGAFSGLSVPPNAGQTGTWTAQFRKNSANGAQVVTNAALSSLNVDPVAAGDKVDLAWGAGTSGLIWAIQSVFSAASDHWAIYACGHQAAGGNVNAGATIYPRLCGSPGGQTTEANVQSQIGAPGTLSGLVVIISLNAATASSTAGLRKNAANGTQTVTIGAGLTGLFQDVTHTDAVVVGDLINGITTAGAGGTISLMVIGVAFKNTVNFLSDLFVSGVSYTAAGYARIYGQSLGTFTEAQAQVSHGFATRMSRYWINVTTNTCTAPSNSTVRINGVQGNQAVTVGAGLLGIFTDVINTDAVGPNDLVCYGTFPGVGGSFQPLTMGITENGNVTYTPNIVANATAAVVRGANTILRSPVLANVPTVQNLRPFRIVQQPLIPTLAQAVSLYFHGRQVFHNRIIDTPGIGIIYKNALRPIKPFVAVQSPLSRGTVRILLTLSGAVSEYSSTVIRAAANYRANTFPIMTQRLAATIIRHNNEQVVALLRESLGRTFPTVIANVVAPYANTFGRAMKTVSTVVALFNRGSPRLYLVESTHVVDLINKAAARPRIINAQTIQWVAFAPARAYLALVAIVSLRPNRVGRAAPAVVNTLNIHTKEAVRLILTQVTQIVSLRNDALHQAEYVDAATTQRLRNRVARAAPVVATVVSSIVDSIVQLATTTIATAVSLLRRRVPNFPLAESEHVMSFDTYTVKRHEATNVVTVQSISFTFGRGMLAVTAVVSLLVKAVRNAVKPLANVVVLFQHTIPTYLLAASEHVVSIEHDTVKRREATSVETEQLFSQLKGHTSIGVTQGVPSSSNNVGKPLAAVVVFTTESFRKGATHIVLAVANTMERVAFSIAHLEDPNAAVVAIERVAVVERPIDVVATVVSADVKAIAKPLEAIEVPVSLFTRVTQVLSFIAVAPVVTLLGRVINIRRVIMAPVIAWVQLVRPMSAVALATVSSLLVRAVTQPRTAVITVSSKLFIPLLRFFLAAANVVAHGANNAGKVAHVNAIVVPMTKYVGGRVRRLFQFMRGISPRS
jgi:hypothetical protein